MNGPIERVSKILALVAATVANLREYYRDLSTSQTPIPDRLLPHPDYLPDSPGLQGLTFISKFHPPDQDGPDSGKPLFRAKLKDQNVLVKLCEVYGKRAHEILAGVGFAPKLHFCGKVSGGTIMVVMDFLEGQTAQSQFRDKTIPPSVMEDIKEAITILHSKGFVYGNLRRPNIMIVDRSKLPRTSRLNEGGIVMDAGIGAMLVNFDWAGKDGEARYPALLDNRPW